MKLTRPRIEPSIRIGVIAANTNWKYTSVDWGKCQSAGRADERDGRLSLFGDVVQDGTRLPDEVAEEPVEEASASVRDAVPRMAEAPC